MTVFDAAGAAWPQTRGWRPRLHAGLRRFWRLLRRVRRNGDAYFDLSDFDQRLIYDLGIEPLELRRIAPGQQGNAIMRLRRMRRRGARRLARLG